MDGAFEGDPVPMEKVKALGKDLCFLSSIYFSKYHCQGDYSLIYPLN